MLIEVVILGLVQGFTEFLPVSSSGHLWIFETLVFHQKASLALEAFLHVATLLAVVIFFRKKIRDLLRGVFLIKSKEVVSQRLYSWKLFLATLVTVPIALLLQPLVEYDLTVKTVGGTLLLTGIFILLAEYVAPKKPRNFSWDIAFWLGLVQGVAVIPGISRSGITLAFLILIGIGRKEAVEISFLLAIPTILGAFIYLLPDLQGEIQNLGPLFVGGIIAFVAALLSIWGMLKWVEKYWKYFSLWCFVAGIFLLVL